jgi:DNA-binding transcriptional LysR family regulator
VAPSVDVNSLSRVELRQLRYFVTLAEELHFGRAAAREHIVQSALSQQVRRLERALGVPLVSRNTRRVELTPAGLRFLADVRQILAQVERAAAAVRAAAEAGPVLRIGVLDEGYAAIRPVLHEFLADHPAVEVRLVHAGLPDQRRALLDGRLDLGVGRASDVPAEIATEMFRLDALGVLVPEGHRLARLTAVPVAQLAAECLLLPDETQAPEFRRFITELCRSTGFFPESFRGSAQGLSAAADLVAGGLCVMVAPHSLAPPAGVRWRPLVQPAPRYPWSLLWRAHETPAPVASVVAAARRLSRRQGWITGDVGLAS